MKVLRRRKRKVPATANTTNDNASADSALGPKRTKKGETASESRQESSDDSSGDEDEKRDEDRDPGGGTGKSVATPASERRNRKMGKRRNIKEVMKDSELGANTLSAQVRNHFFS